MTPDQIFLDNLALIEKIARHACRCKGFSKEETEDFCSGVNVKLIENDYAIIRKFEGRSKLGSYLNTVVQNLMKDHQNHVLGKWRPSAEAVRLGPVAIRLDRLLWRDGISFDAAVQMLQTNEKVEMSWKELDDIRGRLPKRVPRHMEEEDTLQNLFDPEERADVRVVEQEREASRERALEILRVVLEALPDEDQLIVKMQTRFKVSEIAKTLRLDQKQLYRRIEKTLKHLRRELESHGITRELVQEILGG